MSVFRSRQKGKASLGLTSLCLQARKQKELSLKSSIMRELQKRQNQSVYQHNKIQMERRLQVSPNFSPKPVLSPKMHQRKSRRVNNSNRHYSPTINPTPTINVTPNSNKTPQRRHNKQQYLDCSFLTTQSRPQLAINIDKLLQKRTNLFHYGVFKRYVNRLTFCNQEQEDTIKEEIQQQKYDKNAKNPRGFRQSRIFKAHTEPVAEAMPPHKTERHQDLLNALVIKQTRQFNYQVGPPLSDVSLPLLDKSKIKKKAETKGSGERSYQMKITSIRGWNNVQEEY